MIQNLIFVILFLKIFFRAINFIPHVLVNIIRVFLFQNLKQKISKSIKTSQKDHSFYNTVSLKKPHSFYESQLFWNWKWITCSQNTAKKLSQFTNFPANMFLFGVRKIICAAPFLDAQELLSWSTLKANVCIFLRISLRKFFCFQDVAKFYLVTVWGLVEAE